MGFDPMALDALTSSIRELDEGPWRRWLAPVVVLPIDEPAAAIEISLPAPLDGRRFGWSIALEDGGRRDGEFRAGDLEVVAGREIDRVTYLRRRLHVGGALPSGYHRLSLHGSGGTAEATLITAPHRCYLPPALQETGARLWTVSVQLYAMRSRVNWGIGDLGDLARLVSLCAELGVAGVMLNPLHALFPRAPERASPYSPSSRLFLNPLYIDVAAIPGFADCLAARRPIDTSEGRTAMRELRAAPLVQYGTVTRLKMSALEELRRCFHRRHQDAPDSGEGKTSFHAFRDRSGPALRRFAVFQALDEVHGGPNGQRVPWTEWPAGYRRPDTAEVARFAEAHVDRVDFHEYLQWQADEQLAAAAARAREGRMEIGVCRDLAIGVDANGADAWSEQDMLMAQARIGAPPDDFNPLGQEWGILPMNPLALGRKAFRPFADVLRGNMRHAGALRIDHIIGLQRQFLVPAGGKALDGAYVRYPFDDLLAVAALESQRSRCLVVGEDLGTVPEGFRDRMRAAGALGTSVLYFEKSEDGGFRPPADYPELALTSVTTHDLPTIAGYWEGRDIAFRSAAGAYTPGEAERAMETRHRDRDALFRALIDSGTITTTGADGMIAPERIDEELARALHLYLAAAPSRILAIQLDDVLGEVDQINMPGTVDEYPNWQRKLSRDLEDPEIKRLLWDLAAALRRVRPR